MTEFLSTSKQAFSNSRDQVANFFPTTKFHALFCASFSWNTPIELSTFVQVNKKYLYDAMHIALCHPNSHKVQSVILIQHIFFFIIVAGIL